MLGICTEMFPTSYANTPNATTYLNIIKCLTALEDDHFLSSIDYYLKKAEQENIFIRYGWVNHEHEYFLATQNDAYDEIAYLLYSEV